MSSTIGKPRVNFASIKNPLPYPDFLEVQLKSFQDFLQLDTPPEKRKNEGLFKVFAENFPIADTRNNFVLEFLDKVYTLTVQNFIRHVLFRSGALGLNLPLI